MTFLVPKLFRDIAAIPYSNTQKEDLIQNITTVAYGALLTAVSFALFRSNNTLKSFVPFIYLGSLYYLDIQGTSCSAGLIATYLTFALGRLFFSKKLANPVLCGGIALFTAAIAWIGFEVAGHEQKSWLREQIDNLQKG